MIDITLFVLKKKILENAKTVWNAFGNYYKQIDGVSMDSPLGPTLANIMTEFGNAIIKPLITTGTIAFFNDIC